MTARAAFRAARLVPGLPPSLAGLVLLLLGLALLAGCSAALPTEAQIREAPPEQLERLLPPLQARVQSHPDDDEALRRLARAELRLGRTTDALAHAQQAAKVAPFTAQSFLVLGDAYEAAGQPSPALAAFVQAAALEPTLVPTYVHYARVQAGLHADDKALKALDEALRRDPNNFDAYLLKARLLWRQGRLPEAIDAIESARAERPHDEAALLLHVQILDAAGHVDTALELAGQGLQRYPHDRALQVARVHLLREQGDWAAALDALAQLAGEAPLTPAETLLRISVLEGAGRDDQAAAALSALLQAHPDFAPAHIAHARRLALAGEAHQALSEAQQATSLAPEAAEAHYWAAVAHFELGEGSQGDAALADVTGADADRLAVRLLHIERLLAAYQPAQATARVNAVLQAHPGLSPALLLQSAALAQSGSLAQAAQVLEQLPPDFAPAQVRFARLRIAYLRRAWADVVTLGEGLRTHPLLGWRAAYLRGSALLHQGRWADGLAAIQPYLEGPQRRLVFFRLAGYLHLLAGQREAAQRAFEGGLELDPDSPLMIEGLSRIALEKRDWERAGALLKRGLQSPGAYRRLFLERLQRVAQAQGDEAQSHQLLERFLDVTDPARAGAPMQPASELLYGGYYPPYDLAAGAPARTARLAPRSVPGMFVVRARRGLHAVARLRGAGDLVDLGGGEPRLGVQQAVLQGRHVALVQLVQGLAQHLGALRVAHPAPVGEVHVVAPLADVQADEQRAQRQVPVPGVVRLVAVAVEAGRAQDVIGGG